MLPLLAFLSVTGIAYVAAAHAQHRWDRSTNDRAIPTEELPDILEALHLCVDAGMDLLQALSQVIEPRRHEPLGAELYIVAQEVRAGAAKAEAWRRFAQRVPTDDVRMFVASLIQSESLGTGPTRLLRMQCESIRERRFQTAERRAGEAVVKLLLPMICIFASVFVLIFGAVMLSISDGGGL
jgi:tight adherence protein C